MTSSIRSPRLTCQEAFVQFCISVFLAHEPWTAKKPKKVQEQFPGPVDVVASATQLGEADEVGDVARVGTADGDAATVVLGGGDTPADAELGPSVVDDPAMLANVVGMICVGEGVVAEVDIGNSGVGVVGEAHDNNDARVSPLVGGGVAGGSPSGDPVLNDFAMTMANLQNPDLLGLPSMEAPLQFSSVVADAQELDTVFDENVAGIVANPEMA